MKVIQVMLASISAAVAVLGLAVFAYGIMEARSAPQEAALSAMVLAGIVPFYIVARCVEMVLNTRRP